MNCAKYLLLSDIHGDFSYCAQVALRYPNHTIIQLGDFGIFNNQDLMHAEFLPKNIKFFRGNHDSPELCNKSTKYLGDYGEYKDFFFVSGADSIDRHWRTEGVNWWANEELTKKQSDDCLDKWAKSNCEILLCHDCPQYIAENYYLIYDRSFTRMLLQEMIEIRQPKFIFGAHHHREKIVKFTFRGKEINYRCLDINQTFELTI